MELFDLPEEEPEYMALPTATAPPQDVTAHLMEVYGDHEVPGYSITIMQGICLSAAVQLAGRHPHAPESPAIVQATLWLLQLQETISQTITEHDEDHGRVMLEFLHSGWDLAQDIIRYPQEAHHANHEDRVQSEDPESQH